MSNEVFVTGPSASVTFIATLPKPAGMSLSRGLSGSANYSSVGLRIEYHAEKSPVRGCFRLVGEAHAEDLEALPASLREVVQEWLKAKAEELEERYDGQRKEGRLVAQLGPEGEAPARRKPRRHLTLVR